MKTIEDRGIKQVEVLKTLKVEKKSGNRINWRTFSKKIRNIKIKNEIDEIKKWEEKIKRKDLIYKANKYKYDFQQYETIRSFGESIYNGKINVDETKMDQSNLL